MYIHTHVYMPVVYVCVDVYINKYVYMHETTRMYAHTPKHKQVTVYMQECVHTYTH